MNILGFVGSPRKRGNSTLLLEQLLAGARAAGAQTEVIRPWKMRLGPCIACEGCYATGRCVVNDEFQSVYDRIIVADAIVLATPIYFGGPSAQIKPLIDRGQCFWAMRDVLKAAMPPAPAGQPRKGVLIATSGIRRDHMFDCARRAFSFWMRSLQGDIWGEIVRSGLEEQEEILRDAPTMEWVYLMGKRLAAGLTPA
jgi:multimeric flavodoxin WrbA